MKWPWQRRRRLDLELLATLPDREPEDRWWSAFTDGDQLVALADVERLCGGRLPSKCTIRLADDGLSCVDLATAETLIVLAELERRRYEGRTTATV